MHMTVMNVNLGKWQQTTYVYEIKNLVILDQLAVIFHEIECVCAFM